IETAAQVHGKEVVVMPMIGGSGPNYAFKHYLGVPIVTSGAAHEESRTHAPNENMRVDLFELGIRHSAHLAYRFAIET
ncbi:MAG: peptidase M20, partial [Anaerolineales bacterium]